MILTAINDGRFKFDSMQYGVDTLVSAKAVIYGDSIGSSRVELSKLRAYSKAGVDINSMAVVLDPLGECRVHADVSSHIDITSLREVLPLVDGIELEGRNNTRIVCRASKENILNQNYGAIYLRGESRFDDMRILIDGRKLADSTLHTTYFYTEMDEAHFNFGSEKLNSDTLFDRRNIAADISLRVSH